MMTTDIVTYDDLLELHEMELELDFLVSDLEEDWDGEPEEYSYGVQPWHKLWLFGIVLDDDKIERLTGYWNPEGSINGNRSDYYVPDDYDSEVALLPAWDVLNRF